MSTVLLITLAGSALIVAAYTLLAVTIWRRHNESLPPGERGPASFRANVSGLVVYSLMVGGLGLGALIIGGRPIARQVISAGWPTVEGTITRVDIERQTISGRVAAEQWMPIVEYEYTLDGQTYTGDSITFSGPQPSTRQADAAQRVEPYHVGDAVSVTVNPADPQTAALHREAATASYWIAAAGLLLMALHLLGLEIGARRRRPPIEDSSPSPRG